MKKAFNSTSLLISERCLSLFFLVSFKVALMASQNEESWKLLSEIGAKDWFTSIYFVNRQTGWVSTSGGKIFHTKDGAKTWEEQYSPTTVKFNDLKFVNQDVGWAVGFNDTLLHTTNGGIAWKVVMSDSQKPKGALLSVFFINESAGWISWF